MNWLRDDKLVLALIVSVGVAFALVDASQPAQAAPSATVPMCEAINQAGAITVYLCEPDNGPPYLVNSVGFMMGME